MSLRAAAAVCVYAQLLTLADVVRSQGKYSPAVDSYFYCHIIAGESVLTYSDSCWYV